MSPLDISGDERQDTDTEAEAEADDDLAIETPPSAEIDITDDDPDANRALTPAQRIRAQAKEATRQALLESGLAMTVEQEGEIPSIEAICARAGYTRGAFYVYFRDRDHFVNEMLEWVLTDIIQDLFERRGAGAATVHEIVAQFNTDLSRGSMPEVEQNIRAAYLAVLRELRSGSDLQGAHARLMTGICEQLETRVRESQEAGSVRSDVDAYATATLLVLTAIGAIVWNGLGILREGTDLGDALITLIDSPAYTS